MAQPSIAKFIFTSIKPFSKWIVLRLLVACIIAMDITFRPYMLKIFFDRLPGVPADKVYATLLPPLAFYIGMFFLIISMYRLWDFIWLKINPPLKRHIALLLMDKMMFHSQQLFQRNLSGTLGGKIKDVMSSVPDLLKHLIDQFFCNTIALIIALFTMWTISPYFSLGLAVWLTIFINGSWILSKKIRSLSVKASEARAAALGSMIDTLSNIMSVRLFANQKVEHSYLKGVLNTYVENDQKRDIYILKALSIQGLSFIIYQSICIIFLIVGYKNGIVTPGDFVLILTLNTAIIDQLWTLSDDFKKFADYLGNITQGLNVVLSPIELHDAPNAKKLVVTNGKIVFNNMEFQYQGALPLFKSKNVTIEGGQKVGLVGYSGSGKSTFANLIVRMFDVTSGEILIDNQNIKEVTQESLRLNVATIPQDSSLFHRTIMENIRYGNVHATDAQVIQAAKEADAHEFIMSLPQQYDTLVSDRGLKLSGGQRQRIAIARAILKNAPILILDEATSQLDSITEAKIQESLAQLMSTKTTIVIAHRLSTLLSMDRILVFDQGKIVEDGTHEQLIQKNGVYTRMWNAQLDGFLPINQQS